VSLVISKEIMGTIAVLIGIASYAIYAWQSLRGEARPHPLSWLIFGILSGTGYLVQLDQAAGPGSWVTGITTVVCLLLCVTSFWQGERTFPWYEWAFLSAAALVFGFYLWSREPTLSAVLATVVAVLGFGPTVTKSWSRPLTDSVTTFTLNGVKFIPSLFAMNSISIATCVFPGTLVVANLAVALTIYLRRLQVQT